MPVLVAIIVLSPWLAADTTSMLQHGRSFMSAGLTVYWAIKNSFFLDVLSLFPIDETIQITDKL